MDNGWEVFDERHEREYKYWIKNIKLGVAKRQKGEWTPVQYHQHMIEIAKQVRLPHQEILSMEKELEFIKKNGFKEYIKKIEESNIIRRKR